ncbi:MAG: rhomboid family intramembrane serine protease, partial [Alphaproteobacteria bacterium]
YTLAIGFGLVPARLFDGAELPRDLAQVTPLLSLITHQFLHGDWPHLLFNMLFLWVFGDNIEDAVGHRRFLAFFIGCGIAGGLLQGAVNMESVVPTIGASGAISGLLGAYVVLHPRARILVLAFTFIPLRLPALLVIGTWFAQDIIWATMGGGGRVAFWAHIGGAIAGALLINFVRPHRKERRLSPWVRR